MVKESNSNFQHYIWPIRTHYTFVSTNDHICRILTATACHSSLQLLPSYIWSLLIMKWYRISSLSLSYFSSALEDTIVLTSTWKCLIDIKMEVQLGAVFDDEEKAEDWPEMRCQTWRSHLVIVRIICRGPTWGLEPKIFLSTFSLTASLISPRNYNPPLPDEKVKKEYLFWVLKTPKIDDSYSW